MINSRKHIVQVPIATVVDTAIANILIAECKQDVTVSLGREIQVGAIVKAVYIEMWVVGEGNNTVSTNITFQKLPAGSPDMLPADATNLHSYEGKNDIYYISQGVIGDTNSNPVPFLRGWYKIPKSKQRMANGQKLVLNIRSLANDTQFCGLFIYKEYF